MPLTTKTITVNFPDAPGATLYAQLIGGLHRTSAPTGLSTRIHNTTLDDGGVGQLLVWATDDPGSYPPDAVWHFWLVAPGRGQWDTLVQIPAALPSPIALEDLPRAIPLPAPAGWMTFIPLDQKGTSNGVAPLGVDSLVPSRYLPPTMPPGAHALSHALAGSDPVSPASIGAVDVTALGVTVATLDGGGHVPAGQLPALSITDTYVVNTESEMLALTAQRGDVAVRTDLSESFILAADDPTILGNWTLLQTSPRGVTTVNDLSGAVTLDDSNLSGQDPRAGNVTHTMRVIAANLSTAIDANTANISVNTVSIADEAVARVSADSTHAALTTTAHGGIVASTDTRLTNSRPPMGNAAGELSGTYPGPYVVQPFPHNFRIAATYGVELQGDNGRWYRIVVTSGTLSALDLTTPAAPSFATPGRIQWEGDSLTVGAGASIPATTGYPPQLIDLEGGRWVAAINAATNGDTLQAIAAGELSQITAYRDPARTNILMLLAGTNDLTNGRTAAQIEADLQTYCAAARAAGWTGVHKIVLGTIFDRNEFHGVANPYETQRQVFNTWLRANYGTYADALIDFAADGRLNNSSNTTYFADGTHPNDTGCGVMATLAQAVVDTLYPPSSTLLTGLIAYWKLDEASGTRADSTTNAHTLTPSGTVGQAAGKLGNALSLTGAGYLIAPDATDLRGNQTLTLAGWIYLTDKTTDSVLFAKVDSGAGGAEYDLTYNSSTDRFEFRGWKVGTNPAGSATASTFGSPTLNTWYHVRCYIDPSAGANGTVGIAVNNAAPNTQALSGAIAAGTSRLIVGVNNYVGTQATVRLDGWGVWGRLLTTDEQAALYNSGAGRDYPF